MQCRQDLHPLYNEVLRFVNFANLDPNYIYNIFQKDDLNKITKLVVDVATQVAVYDKFTALNLLNTAKLSPLGVTNSGFFHKNYLTQINACEKEILNLPQPTVSQQPYLPQQQPTAQSKADKKSKSHKKISISSALRGTSAAANLASHASNHTSLFASAADKVTTVASTATSILPGFAFI